MKLIFPVEISSVSEFVAVRGLVKVTVKSLVPELV